MTKSLDDVLKDAQSLPEAERQQIVVEVEKLIVAARRRAVQAMIERIDRESPFRGRAEDMIKFVQQDRANWAFGPDREGVA
jgi:hypothetical protein